MSDYENLRKKLNEIHEWPSSYMFKFIFPNDNQTLALIQSQFGELAKTHIKSSGSGKYISFTAVEMMMSAEEIIQRYQKLEGIKGLMAL